MASYAACRLVYLDTREDLGAMGCGAAAVVAMEATGEGDPSGESARRAQPQPSGLCVTVRSRTPESTARATHSDTPSSRSSMPYHLLPRGVYQGSRLSALQILIAVSFLRFHNPRHLCLRNLRDALGEGVAPGRQGNVPKIAAANQSLEANREPFSAVGWPKLSPKALRKSRTVTKASGLASGITVEETAPR
jgi:hypothetical protein